MDFIGGSAISRLDFVRCGIGYITRDKLKRMRFYEQKWNAELEITELNFIAHYYY